MKLQFKQVVLNLLTQMLSRIYICIGNPSKRAILMGFPSSKHIKSGLRDGYFRDLMDRFPPSHSASIIRIIPCLPAYHTMLSYKNSTSDLNIPPFLNSLVALHKRTIYSRINNKVFSCLLSKLTRNKYFICRFSFHSSRSRKNDISNNNF